MTICRGRQRSDAQQLAAYLTSDPTAELGETSGVIATAFQEPTALARDMDARVRAAQAITELSTLAAGSKCRAELFHCSVNPNPKDPVWTPEQYRRAWEVFEKEHGLTGHAFVEVYHRDGEGRRHAHRAYAVVKDGKAAKLSWTRINNEKIGRLLEHEYGHAFVPGPNQPKVLKWLEKSDDPQHRACAEAMRAAGLLTGPEKDGADEWEREQAARVNVPVKDVEKAAGEAWAAAEGDGARFLAELEARGLGLAKGDKAPAVLVDAGTGIHPTIGRRVFAGLPKGHPARAATHQEQTKAIMAAVSGLPLPTVDQARAQLATAPRAASAPASAAPVAGAPSARTSRQIDAAVYDAWTKADSGPAFQAALRDAGLTLCRGSKPGHWVVIDPSQRVLRREDEHDLVRSLLSAGKAQGVKRKTAEVRPEVEARLNGLELPTVVQALGQDAAPRSGTPGPVVLPRKKAPATTDAAGIIATLTKGRTVFTEAALDRALQAVGDEGRRLALKAEILGRQGTVTLGVDKQGRGVFTTRTLAEAEARLLDCAAMQAASVDHAVKRDVVEKELRAYAADVNAKSGYELGDDQEGGIRHVTAGANLTLINGFAGTGKSTLMTGANRIWEAEGKTVTGMAISGVAAARLGESGIKSDTIAARLMAYDRAATADALRTTGWFDESSRKAVLDALDHWAKTAKPKDVAGIEKMRNEVDFADNITHLSRGTRKWLDKWCDRQAAQDLDGNTVVVVDEAGMVDVPTMARILAHAERRGAKVVLLGDDEQLQPIDPGAAFRILQQRVARAYELRNVVRQADTKDAAGNVVVSRAWQREATKNFAVGNAASAQSAVMAYAERGCVRVDLAGIGPQEDRYREAEAALGCALTDADRRRIDTVTDYAWGRLEAGTLWREIDRVSQETGAAPDAHPLYARFRAAQERRAAAAVAIRADLDGCRPWLARYDVDGQGLAADILHAEGTRRAEAQARSAAHARTLGITEIESDVSLAFDFRAGARDALLADWKADLDRDGPGVSSIILAYTRADVARLNHGARALMREAGHLRGEDVTVQTEIIDHDTGEVERGELAVAVGDRLMTLTNNRTLGVQNGTTGTVEAILRNADGETVITFVTDDDKRRVDLDTATFKALAHSYSSTIHRAQGVTVRRAYVLGHHAMDRHMAYVAWSRHKDDVRAYVGTGDGLTVEGLAAQLGKANSADAISDYADPRAVLRDPHGVMLDMRRTVYEASATVRDLGDRLDRAADQTLTTALRDGAPRVRDLGQRLDAAATRATETQPNQEAPRHVRPIRSRFDTAYQPRFGGFAAGEAAESLDRVPDLQSVPVAFDGDGTPLLLPGDEAHKLHEQEAGAADGLRRPVVRGRVTDDAQDNGRTSEDNATPLQDQTNAFTKKETADNTQPFGYTGDGAPKDGEGPTLRRFTDLHTAYRVMLADPRSTAADRQAMRAQLRTLARDLPDAAFADAPKDIRAAAVRFRRTTAARQTGPTVKQ